MYGNHSVGQTVGASTRHHPTSLFDYQFSCARLLGFRPRRPNGAIPGKQWCLHGGWLPARRGGRFLLQHHPRAREVLEETFLLTWRREDTTCMSTPMPTPSAPCSPQLPCAMPRRRRLESLQSQRKPTPPSTIDAAPAGGPRARQQPRAQARRTLSNGYPPPAGCRASRACTKLY